MIDLFYQFDIGDVASTVFGRVFNPTLAAFCGHMVNFWFNGLLWATYAGVAIRIAAAIA